MSLSDLQQCAGVSLKPEYFSHITTMQGNNIWFEAHPENYMIGGGPRLQGLQAAAERFPISLHGVGASLGGLELTPDEHIRALKRLVSLIEPAVVSEHAVWSRHDGQYFADLLPLPRTQAVLSRLIRGVNHLQENLGRKILLENPSNYLSFSSEMDEPMFMVEVAQRTGCGLLLDVNNVYVSANNCGIDAREYILQIPPALVGEIHVAGFTPDDNFGEKLLIDTHAAPVSEDVWHLLAFTLNHTGPVPVLIERDGNLPPFDELLAEKQRADDLIIDAAREKDSTNE